MWQKYKFTKKNEKVELLSIHCNSSAEQGTMNFCIRRYSNCIRTILAVLALRREMSMSLPTENHDEHHKEVNTYEYS